jgi:hypothetical protein
MQDQCLNRAAVLSGWVGPWVVGWLEDVTGKTTTGRYVVAGVEILAAILILCFIPRRADGGESGRNE